QYITIDFDEAWDVSVKAVFPDAMILRCTFHAIQLLTRGLIKEFNRLQRAMNSNFINECNEARRLSLAAERGENITTKKPLTQDFCKRWFDFSREIITLQQANEPRSFTVSLEELLTRIQTWNADVFKRFKTKLDAKMPKGVFTMKGMAIFKPGLGKKWRSMLTGIRQEREGKKSEFANAKYLLMKKPRNMEKWEEKALRAFLKENPWARVYRETTRRFYNLLDNPPETTPSLDFLDNMLHEDSHDWLKSAIHTLKEKREEVFNFVKVLKAHPEWKDKPMFKVNPEPAMKRINDVARVQYGLRSDSMASFKLEQYLKCPILISPAVLAENGVKLN
nr:hypothetical protein [Candidatus Sigynarchaeota archaeon]